MKLTKSTINLMDALIFSICLYTIATLGNSLISFIPLSRLLGALIALIIVALMLHKLSKKYLIVLMCVGFILMYSSLVAIDLSISVKDAVWYIVTILFVCCASRTSFFTRFQSAFFSNKLFIKPTIIISNIILLVAIFSPSSYSNDSGWGEGESYFIGFAENGHTLASCCCLLLTLVLAHYKGQKINLIECLLLIPAIYGIMFSGARTFVIPVVVLLIIYVIKKIKNPVHRIVVVILVMSIFVVVLLNSSMMSKFEFTLNNQYAADLMDSLTNGRSLFWKYDIDAFLSYSPIAKLFGQGFDHVYFVNKANVGLAIWAHNDIINNLLSTGIFGSILYLYVWFSFVYKIILKKENKIEFASKVLFVIYIFGPMFINGLFAYQHYVYSCLILAIILFNKPKQKEYNISM